MQNNYNTDFSFFPPFFAEYNKHIDINSSANDDHIEIYDTFIPKFTLLDIVFILCGKSNSSIFKIRQDIVPCSTLKQK